MSAGQGRVGIKPYCVEVDVEAAASIDHDAVPVVIDCVIIIADTCNIPDEIIEYFDVAGSDRWCEYNARGTIAGGVVVLDIAYLIIADVYTGQCAVHIYAGGKACTVAAQVVDGIVMEGNVGIADAAGYIDADWCIGAGTCIGQPANCIIADRHVFAGSGQPDTPVKLGICCGEIAYCIARYCTIVHALCIDPYQPDGISPRAVQEIITDVQVIAQGRHYGISIDPDIGLAEIIILQSNIRKITRVAYSSTVADKECGRAGGPVGQYTVLDGYIIDRGSTVRTDDKYVTIGSISISDQKVPAAAAVIGAVYGDIIGTIQAYKRAAADTSADLGGGTAARLQGKGRITGPAAATGVQYCCCCFGGVAGYGYGYTALMGTGIYSIKCSFERSIAGGTGSAGSGRNVDLGRCRTNQEKAAGKGKHQVQKVP